MSHLIDNELGNIVKTVGFSYSDIIKNLACVFFSGGSGAEKWGQPPFPIF